MTRNKPSVSRHDKVDKSEHNNNNNKNEHNKNRERVNNQINNTEKIEQSNNNNNNSTVDNNTDNNNNNKPGSTVYDDKREDTKVIADMSVRRDDAGGKSNPVGARSTMNNNNIKKATKNSNHNSQREDTEQVGGAGMKPNVWVKSNPHKGSTTKKGSSGELIKPSNSLLDSYGFVRSTSNWSMGKVRVPPAIEQDGQMAIQGPGLMSAWSSLSSLNVCQSSPIIGQKETQEEIDEIIASGVPDPGQEDDVLDLWVVDEINVETTSGLAHLQTMAKTNRIMVRGEDDGTCSLEGDSTALFKSLGRGGVRNLLLDLARSNAATLSVMEGSKRKWLTVGPYEGSKMHYNGARGTLRITTKKHLDTSVGPTGLGSSTGVQTNTKEDLGEVHIVEKGLLEYDDLGNPVDDECEVVCNETIPPPLASPLVFEGSPGVAEWTLECKAWKGSEYPPPGMNAKFSGSVAKLRVGPSPIQGNGVFVKLKLLKGELLGFYEGIATENKGPYVMRVFNHNVDGSPAILGRVSMYAMINEDLYGGVPNVEVLPGGLFRALRDIAVGEELVIRYGSGYVWDDLKDLTLQALTIEVFSLIPSLWGMIPNVWSELKARHDTLSRWISKLVEGKIPSSSLHSSSNNDPLEPRMELARLITSGPFVRRFNFRYFNREVGRRWRVQGFDKNWEIRRNFSSAWNGFSLMDIPFGMVVLENEPVRSLVGWLKTAALKVGNYRLRAEPRITEESGEIRVSIRFGTRRRDMLIAGANKCKSMAELRSWALTERIWRVSYRNNPIDDN